MGVVEGTEIYLAKLNQLVPSNYLTFSLSGFPSKFLHSMQLHPLQYRPPWKQSQYFLRQ